MTYTPVFRGLLIAFTTLLLVRGESLAADTVQIHQTDSAALTITVRSKRTLHRAPPIALTVM